LYSHEQEFLAFFLFPSPMDGPTYAALRVWGLASGASPVSSYETSFFFRTTYPYARFCCSTFAGVQQCSSAGVLFGKRRASRVGRQLVMPASDANSTQT
jgi:hypothetical protein